MTHVPRAGHVSVGATCRIVWHTTVDPWTLRWTVAGTDQRVVIQLAVGMSRLVQNARWTRDDTAPDDEGVLTYDAETQKWLVRGSIAASEERLVRLEAFMLLVDNRERERAR